MKVLVYGAGVIGCFLAHALCQAQNEVSLLARGEWKEQLIQNGLVIHRHLQKKTTVDRLQIVESINSGHYDIVFAVMQHQQMEGILDDLAAADAPMVVLVGNNMSAPEMERVILEKTAVPKTVLFGFQSTGGNRENGHLECVHLGGPTLYLGGLHQDLTKSQKAWFSQLFQGSGFSLNWQDDMDGWYKSHLAFILPVAYLCYATGCHLKESTKAQRRQLLDAANEGYSLLKELCIPIRPAGEDSWYHPGMKRWLCILIVYAMAKTRIGKLCASDHCRHAVAEMEGLDKKWEQMRQKAPNFAMPNWDALRASMPDWERLHEIYDKKEKALKGDSWHAV